MTLRVGLAGGIGCGKSTVAKMFQDLGALIIDTDAISHQLTNSSGAAIPLIREAFGDAYISTDGALDRAKMRQSVFSDAVAKQKLEALLHPLILAEVQTRLEDAEHYPYAIIVVPLLFNNPTYLQLIQRILLVDCEEQLQITRVMQRSRLSEAEVRTIIAQQTSREERLRRADDVVVNNGNLANLSSRVEALHATYISLKSQNGD